MVSLTPRWQTRAWTAKQRQLRQLTIIVVPRPSFGVEIEPEHGSYGHPEQRDPVANRSRHHCWPRQERVQRNDYSEGPSKATPDFP